jgi:hypothetical protein
MASKKMFSRLPLRTVAIRPRPRLGLKELSMGMSGDFENNMWPRIISDETCSRRCVTLDAEKRSADVTPVITNASSSELLVTQSVDVELIRYSSRVLCPKPRALPRRGFFFEQRSGRTVKSASL